MIPRIYKPLISKSFFLFGPRATGKSTWVKEKYPKAIVIDLLESETYLRLSAQPSRIREFFLDAVEWIFVDEIQRIPELLNEIHHHIEKNKKVKFILTGSSARKLRRGAVNLLAGRAYQTNFYPLTIWELGKDFNLTHALKFGLLPSVWNSGEDPKKYLSSYVYTYLREEVQAEGLTRTLEVFSRFLESISFSQAQTLNMSTVARDVGIDSKLVANYIEILEDLLLAKRLRCFTKKAKRKMALHSKFFFFDCGVFRTLRPIGPLDSESELNGPSLETIFLNHHQVWVEANGLKQELFYWRTQSKIEVDFVSYGEAGFFAFEVKSSDRVRAEDLEGLRLFLKDYPQAKAYFLYGGKRKYRDEGIEIIPFVEGIEILRSLG